MRILLVDDNEDYLMMLRKVLYAAGYDVQTAGDGEEACDILTHHDIDLILSDIRMPLFDGLKLHAFAREMDRYKSTKFVFISAFRNVYGDMVQLDPEKDFFLDKMTPFDDILRLVDKLLFGDFVRLWTDIRVA